MRTAAFMILATIFATVVGAYAALPSDSIFYRAPVNGPIQLSGVDPAVAKLFASQNTLGAHEDWEIPNYGHYTTVPIATSLEDWLNDEALHSR